MPDLLVLCYHAVSRSWPAALSVTPEALEDQIAMLVRRGYRGARLTDALERDPDAQVVCVTFDDGYRSVLELAKPILDGYGYPATLFIPTDWPGAGRVMRWPGIEDWLGTEHERELDPLSWTEVRELAESGWEIGSHSCSHPRLPSLKDEALARELTDSKARIETELGRSCTSLAYPYGLVDARVGRAVAASGYRWAVTIPRVLAPVRPLRWPRAPIFHDDDMRRFRAKVSPWLRRARSSRTGNWLDRARTHGSED